jgi:hypothetical protein
MSRGREGIRMKAWWFVVLRVDLDMELERKRKMAKSIMGVRSQFVVLLLSASQEPG